MARNHLLFAAFIGALLLGPKIPLELAGLPSKTGLPISIAVLLLWTVLSPRLLLRTTGLRRNLPVAGLLIFAIYAFLVSAASLDWVAILYAGQYLVYAVLGGMLLSGYVENVASRGELERSYHILAFSGGLFTLGVIVSVWTGPFYPHQTLWTEQRWDGIALQRGVGFADGANTAAATLLVAIPTFLYLYSDLRPRLGLLLGLLSITALVATLSRSGILALALGIGSLLCLKLVPLLLGGTVRLSAARKAWHRFAVSALTAGFVLFAIETLGGEFALSAMRVGLGLGETRIVEQDFQARADIWAEAVERWADDTPVGWVLGRGFRATARLDDGEEAWMTAHNVYLSVLGDFGLLGFCLFLIPLLYAVCMLAAQLLRGSDGAGSRATFVMLIALVVHNMSETFLYSPILLMLVILLLLLTKSVEARLHQ